MCFPVILGRFVTFKSINSRSHSVIQDAELTFQTLTTRKGASELPWKAIRTRPHQQEPIQTSVRKYLPVWLNECFSTHDLLYHTLREPLPKRVIDIGQSSGNSALRLYETKGESERYICLSHCWGDFQPICTTTANINDYKKSISWKSLPKTFQDTVDLARFLNVRYLWIDSLCIIQDDLKDWEREAAEMANIYSKSYLTIAATAAFDCSQGLYSNSTQQITGPHELKVTKKHLYMLYHYHHMMLMKYLQRFLMLDRTFLS